MKIKTIWREISGTELFDRDVNAALEEGWVLIKREHHWGSNLAGNRAEPPMLYAELILPDAPAESEPETIDAMKAFQVVKEDCNRHRFCADCQLYSLCDHRPPSLWDDLK